MAWPRPEIIFVITYTVIMIGLGWFMHQLINHHWVINAIEICRGK